MTKKQKIKSIITSGVILILLTITCFFYNAINKGLTKWLQKEFNVLFVENNMIVHFIDVGQGDAMAINLPNGEVMLIDCGPQSSNVKYCNYIKENVLGLKNNKEVDYLILTHADADHVGGALKVLHEFDVKKVYLPPIDSETDTYLGLKNFAYNNCDVELIERSTGFMVDGCKINIMGLYDIHDTNESSAVIKIEYLNKSFIFMADVSAYVEDLLIQEYGNELDCDVVKISHHGSDTSSSLDFLQMVSPDYAVISVGQNSYGHPTTEVLENINTVNAKLLRTDINGSIAFAVGQDYDLTCNYGTYLISSFYLDYRIFVLIVDLMLIVNVVIVLIKKDKRNSKKLKRKNK